MWNVGTLVLLIITALTLMAVLAPRLSCWEQSGSRLVRGWATIGIIGVIGLATGSIALSFSILIVLGS